MAQTTPAFPPRHPEAKHRPRMLFHVLPFLGTPINKRSRFTGVRIRSPKFLPSSERRSLRTDSGNYMALKMGIAGRDWGVLGVGIMVMVSCFVPGDGHEFQVGGKDGWTQLNPANATAPHETYNQWAERNRFRVGDTLLFVYEAKEDSVLQVSEEHYRRCDGSKPIASYDNGRTVIKLTTAGPHYFISGVKERCESSEKMVVVVLALRGGGSAHGAAAPSPIEEGKGKPFYTTPSVGPEGRPANVAAAPLRSDVPSMGFLGAAFCVLNLLSFAMAPYSL